MKTGPAAAIPLATLLLLGSSAAFAQTDHLAPPVTETSETLRNNGHLQPTEGQVQRLESEKLGRSGNFVDRPTTAKAIDQIYREEMQLSASSQENPQFTDSPNAMR
jgi:hypothetical protein